MAPAISSWAARKFAFGSVSIPKIRSIRRTSARTALTTGERIVTMARSSPETRAAVTSALVMA